jgi:predicted ArsR family transcriptional regulator
VEQSDLGDRVAGVAALAEPVRRELYLYVVGQDSPVSRDQACEGLGIARHTAKFHLDRLVEEGLLTTSFKRLGERQGPGGGRPTKLYQRSDRELAVTVPERRYDLAGELMAQAIEDSAREGVVVLDALRSASRERGRSLGRQVRSALPPQGGRPDVLDATRRVLAAHGYEPAQSAETLELRNCPFHLLAAQHTALVCGMNLALLQGAAEEVGDGLLSARLEPHDGRCCVLLTAT